MHLLLYMYFWKSLVVLLWSKHMKQDILKGLVFLPTLSRYIVEKSLELT